MARAYVLFYDEEGKNPIWSPIAKPFFPFPEYDLAKIIEDRRYLFYGGYVDVWYKSGDRSHAGLWHVLFNGIIAHREPGGSRLYAYQRDGDPIVSVRAFYCIPNDDNEFKYQDIKKGNGDTPIHQDPNKGVFRYKTLSMDEIHELNRNYESILNQVRPEERDDESNTNRE